MTAFSFEISASFVSVGFGKLATVCCFHKPLTSGFFSWQFLKSYQRSKVFLFLQAVFGGQCGGLLFSVAAHSSHLALKCQRFCRQFSGTGWLHFIAKNFSGWTQLILFYSGNFYEYQLPSTFYSSSSIFIQTSFKLIAGR